MLLHTSTTWDLIGCFGIMSGLMHSDTWKLCARFLAIMPTVRAQPHRPSYRCAARATGLGRAPSLASEVSQEMRLARLGDDGTVQSAVVWAWECAEEPWPMQTEGTSLMDCA
ncbi:unnamed protein product [Effrenium voratum]|uniref:Uncharacterized protein n=1 Tax=Effrenium voratum TaxID=2562239 RepID=A0AA36N9X0_9DINO|nr:unnamed protein product [Effrenium voratum]